MNHSRSWTLTVFFLLLLSLGCSKKLSLPTDPTPPALPPPPSQGGIGHVWGYVTDEQGRCLVGAVVEIIEGPKTGQRSEEKGCDYDTGIGYELMQLPIGETVKLRATKEGYLPVEREVVVVRAAAPVTFRLRETDEVWLRGAVFGSGACLRYATVTVIDGPQAGNRGVNECWGGSVGFAVKGLRNGDDIGVRVEARGYRAAEARIVVSGDTENVHHQDFFLQQE